METISLRSVDNETYLSRVSDLAESQGHDDIVASLTKPDAGSTQAYYINHHQRLQVIEPELVATLGDYNARKGAYTVCVVENIGPRFIEALGSAWNLDPTFFVQHATNREREHLWMPDVFTGDRPRSEMKPYDCIDGILEYHGISVRAEAELNSSPNHFPRHCLRSTWDDVETVISNTRISYYRVHSELCESTLTSYKYSTDNATPDLFLVDPPLYLQNKYSSMSRRIRPSLRVPYAGNRGGLLLPQLFELHSDKGIPYSIFEALKSVFKHGWQRALLIRHNEHKPVAFPAAPLSYMLSNSLWQTNVQYLSREIQRISFKEVRSPDLKINETLHNLREDLVAYLISGVTETTKFVPDTVVDFWTVFRESHGIMQDATHDTPVSSHHNTLQTAVELEKLLMETFQLLMSSIIVQDARLSIKQMELSNQQSLRATQLTLLASIYVPLSFVTGIFGMNLKELNGSRLSIWVFFVGVVISMIVTAVIFLGLQEHSKQKGIKSDAKKVPDRVLSTRRASANSDMSNQSVKSDRITERSMA